MDIVSAFANINWLSVIVASVSSFLVGGVWYGPLFGKGWMHAFGFTESDLNTRNMPKVFVVTSDPVELLFGARIPYRELLVVQLFFDLVAGDQCLRIENFSVIVARSGGGRLGAFTQACFAPRVYAAIQIGVTRMADEI